MAGQPGRGRGRGGDWEDRRPLGSEKAHLCDVCGVQPLQHADEAHADDEARLREGGPLGRGDRAPLQRLHAARLHADAVVHRGLGQQADHVDVFTAAEDRNEGLGVDGAGEVAVVLHGTRGLGGRWRTSIAMLGPGDVLQGKMFVGVAAVSTWTTMTRGVATRSMAACTAKPNPWCDESSSMVMLEYGDPGSAAVMRSARRRLYSRYLGSWAVLITPVNCVFVFILFCSWPGLPSK